MVSSQVQYYVKSSDLKKKKNISKDMCIQGKSCRRALLYSYFDSIMSLMSRVVHVDVCAKSCMCIDCKCNSFSICLK